MARHVPFEKLVLLHNHLKDRLEKDREHPPTKDDLWSDCCAVIKSDAPWSAINRVRNLVGTPIARGRKRKVSGDRVAVFLAAQLIALYETIDETPPPALVQFAEGGGVDPMWEHQLTKQVS